MIVNNDNDDDSSSDNNRYDTDNRKLIAEHEEVCREF